MAIDPICGMKVDESSPRTCVKDGSAYYFCSDYCLRRFQGLPEPDEEHAGFGKAFFCPMCAGVESDEPGDCPTCGMALQAASPAGDAEERAEIRRMTGRFWGGALLGLPVFALGMSHLAPASGIHRFAMSPAGLWLQALLAGGTVIGAGWPILVRAARSLRAMSLNMFTLIGLGVAAAYGYSLAAVVAPGAFPESLRHGGRVDVYFESAAVIVFLVLLGQVLEGRARRRTGQALRELMALQPSVAHRIVDGGEADVPAAEVRAGDMLQVRPGERVPADGVMLDQGALDESMITGESMPVDKASGDAVIGGTVCQAGAFRMRATAVGADTVLAHIIRQVTAARHSRAPVQHLADHVAAWFVPCVIGAAAVAFVAWMTVGPEPRLAHAIVSAISVLIIACPCALGLATPMSIMVGVGRGARAGVLIRSAEALELLDRVTVVAIDKTGTLTVGRPRLSRIVAADALGEGECLRLAASVEQSSEHPLGRALVDAARDRGLALERVESFGYTPGGGVRGVVGGRAVLAGTARFLESGGAPVPAAAAEQIARGGGSVVWVSVDGAVAGGLVLEDPLRPSAAKTVRELADMGLFVVLLSGDRPEVVRNLARRLEISESASDVDPAGKALWVQELRRGGSIVLMAGDGVNDAPALAAADVGVAMGTGSAAAMESAEVTLVGGDLRGIVRALRLSRAVVRNTRQNLAMAFAYNVIAVPVAAGALYPLLGMGLSPMLAAAAMSLSSLSVVTNALRLRRVPL